MANYISDILVKIAFQKEYGFTTSMSPEEKLEYIKAANTIFMTIIPDGNYLEYSRKIGWNYRRIADLYTMLDQKDKALEYLLKAEKMATYYDSLAKEKSYKFTSTFCNHITSDMTRSGKYFTGTENEMLSYRLDELKDYFRDDEQFIALRKRLGENTINI